MQWKLTFKQLFTNTAVHLTLSTASTSNHNHNFIVSIYSVSDLMHCTWPSDLTIHYLVHVTYPHVKSFSFSHWKGCPLHCIHWLLNFTSYLLTFKDKGHCCTSLPLDQEKSDLTSGEILAAFNKIGWTANIQRVEVNTLRALVSVSNHWSMVWYNKHVVDTCMYKM